MGVGLDGLSLAFDGHVALDGVSGHFSPGSLTAVAGANGAGKSSLLKAMLGLVRLDAGRVSIDGDKADIAYLPQASAIDDSFPISVADVVAMGLWRRTGAFGRVSRQLGAELAAALDAVGLSGLGRRRFGTLSAGQRQRALFARTLVADAGLILLDEPFTAMDETTTQDLAALVESWHAEGRTVIVVLHDIGQMRALFPEILLLAHRVVAWGPTREVLCADALRSAGLPWLRPGGGEPRAFLP